MNFRLPLRGCFCLIGACSLLARAAEMHFDAAPYALPLPEGQGLMWEDPREINSVSVEFAEPIRPNLKLRLEYWGSHWPRQHLPKDREPGGGDNGWTELGNWHKGDWRIADAEEVSDGNTVRFTFRPINAHEFPELKDYASKGRFTLKIRITADEPLPKIRGMHALTDSMVEERSIRIVLDHPDATNLSAEAFNGRVVRNTAVNPGCAELRIETAVNKDPNTFDRTLVTTTNGTNVFTFKVDDLHDSSLYLPEFGAAVLPDTDRRGYAQVAGENQRAGKRTLYDRISEMPEQTWRSAWDGMPPKKSRICFILGLDGARQKFRLNPDGAVFWRWNDQYMRRLPAKDTPRLDLEKPPLHFQFGLPENPVERYIEEESIPTCITTWEEQGIRVVQTAFATTLEGFKTGAGPPAPDAFAVAMLRFDFTNATSTPRTADLPVTIRGGETNVELRVDSQGLIWNGSRLRGQVLAEGSPVVGSNQVRWTSALAPHSARSIVVKLPFLPLIERSEAAALAALNFEVERNRTGDYWRKVLNKSARLITPEPVLDEFYRALPSHLLINSEIEPGSNRRAARVGSLNYGNYGNESCMMVLDLDRRGYHQEAADCLDMWLHYQGTVGLPGDFDSKEGVLYGAGGYEANGYNQHHGWILWTLAEHYRFSSDEAWLRRVAPNIVAAADWIMREVAQSDRPGKYELARGLLPRGELEDIGDWWTWLSTSCYTWKGLEGAAWALEQIRHSDARRIRVAADEYHKHLLDSFLAASARSPVVRLRDGTSVPQIPSYVERRGRSFGWICQTLEGAIHLIITKAIDPKSVQAQWILKDYEDNLFLSNQYGYTLDDFDKYWFGRGGMSMQACLLLDVEAYLYRDDVKQALRAMFNAIAVNHFPDVHMNTEHALPEMGDWRGDHYKTSDEANVCGWLRYLFIREEGDTLLIGQAIPREWLKPGQKCGMENAATWFGKTSVVYAGEPGKITARLDGPTRNPPRAIRLRFRTPDGKVPTRVTVNGQSWEKLEDDWTILPGSIGRAEVTATY